jgi:hypothetical protein
MCRHVYGQGYLRIKFQRPSPKNSASNPKLSKISHDHHGVNLRMAIKKFPEFFHIDGFVHHGFVQPEQSVTVISMCKFSRDCAMQSGRSDATSGRQGQWFLHHRLLCSNSSPRKTFFSSLKHRTLLISLRVTFACFLLWKLVSHLGHQIECDGRTHKLTRASMLVLVNIRNCKIWCLSGFQRRNTHTTVCESWSTRPKV